jgi:3-phenylpropionate/trans-cinnamate dioxygenase ferredoxin subunit
MAEGTTAAEVVVCSLQAMIDTPILPVRARDRQLLVIRDGYRLVACERACPHEQADLALGRCAGGKLFCPRHFAWFDLRDGKVSAGWEVRALRLYHVVIRDHEVVVVLSDSVPPPGADRREIPDR